MKKTLATALIAVVVCAGVVLLVSLVMPRIDRYMEKNKAEGVAIGRDPLVVAWAALSYIKRTGTVPATPSDCVSVDQESSRRFNRSDKARDYEFLAIDWPPKESDVLLRSVFDRMTLWFPEHPDDLAVRDGVLVLRDTSEPVQMLSIAGVDPADSIGLRTANLWLWEGWSCLVKGEPTGFEWLDSYEPGK